MYRSLLFSLACLVSTTVNAIEYSLPADNSNIIGTMEYYQVSKGDSLADIANRYNVGFLALLEANKGVDPFLPAIGTLLAVPTQLILPDVKRQGIIINLAELRLYYFPADDDSIVHVFPIGIGRVGRETPPMVTRISQKIENPTWTPTANIRKEYLEQRNIELPAVVPAGPENPLGDYAMRLGYGYGEYLIHGTNKDFGIGLRVSAGCIRMNPWDIEWLFPQVPEATPVQVINQPLKQTVEPDGTLFVEVHQPLSKTEEQVGQPKKVRANSFLKSVVEDDRVAESRLSAALSLQMGIPVEITKY
ncbi:L,D-transpeptidase family protein [Photobacterium sp.]|uniref:L,D-transpeptidase family protein n=1 Tax=Photobacterium sp. TaxID=660 RepID=UPI00299E906E|nr:L,D-transpeptidase family protein [Photobacterium sp.]MDX1302097.1 L,D-transpeptidase family protein [Photobacterium sp.]